MAKNFLTVFNGGNAIASNYQQRHYNEWKKKCEFWIWFLNFLQTVGAFHKIMEKCNGMDYNKYMRFWFFFSLFSNAYGQCDRINVRVCGSAACVRLNRECKWGKKIFILQKLNVRGIRKLISIFHSFPNTCCTQDRLLNWRFILFQPVSRRRENLFPPSNGYRVAK